MEIKYCEHLELLFVCVRKAKKHKLKNSKVQLFKARLESTLCRKYLVGKKVTGCCMAHEQENVAQQ